MAPITILIPGQRVRSRAGVEHEAPLPGRPLGGRWSALACWSRPAPGRRPHAGAEPPGDLRGAAAALLSEAIRIDTVNPPGERRAARGALRRSPARPRGRGRLIELLATVAVGRAAPGRACPGAGRRPVVLLSHLDVVPADAARMVGGPVRGSGGGGLRGRAGGPRREGGERRPSAGPPRARAPGAPLERDVIFLATPDEETGGRAGAGFLTSAPRAPSRRRVPAHRGRGDPAGRGRASRTSGASRSARRAPAGSSSWRRAIRATARRRPTTRPSRRSSPPSSGWARLRDGAGGARGGAHVRGARGDRAARGPLRPAQPRLALAADPAFRARFLAVPRRARSCATRAPITVLEGGERTNVIPRGPAPIDARLLPGASAARTSPKRLREPIPDPAVDSRSCSTSRAPPRPRRRSSTRSSAWPRELAPGVVVPRVISGFTDAHWFRELGIVSYGFVPRWLAPSRDARRPRPERAHLRSRTSARLDAARCWRARRRGPRAGAERVAAGAN